MEQQCKAQQANNKENYHDFRAAINVVLYFLSCQSGIIQQNIHSFFFFFFFFFTPASVLLYHPVSKSNP